MKKLLSLLTAILFVGSMWATDEPISFASPTEAGSSTTYTLTWTSNTSCDIKQEKGTSSTSVSSSYKTSPRWYQNHLITFTPKGGATITKVVITGSSSYNGQTISFNSGEGTVTNTNNTTTTITGSWTSAFQLKMGSQCRVSSVTVTYTSSTPSVSATPASFEVDAEEHNSQSVALTYENWGEENPVMSDVTIHTGTPCETGEGGNEATDPWIDNISIAADHKSFTFDIAENEDVVNSRTLYLNFYALGSSKESSVVIPVTQSKATITTMDGIFTASETSGTYDVNINKWWISAVSSYNAYVTDGEKGFSIYKSGHGFVEGDTLSGSVSFSLTRYNGAAQTYALTASTEGLTVKSGTAANAQETTIDALAAVNTGALVTLKKVTYNEEAGTFVKGDKAIAITSISGFTPSLENGTKYNVTGVFVYNTDATSTAGKRILLRKSGDIVVTPCENEVTITKGTETNGTYDLSATSVCGDDEGGDVFIQNIVPAAGYEFDEITSTSGTVDNVNKKVTAIKAATTITVKFKELPKYTVSFVTGKYNPIVTAITETVGGQGITLPAGVTPVKTGWSFAGWSEIVILTETTETPTLLEADSKYYPANNITLYSVYERTEGGGTTPSAYEVGDEGDFVLAALVEGEENTWYALPEDPTVNSGKITGDEITVLNAKGVNYVASDDATGYTWTIAKSGDYYTISDGTNYVYHANGGNSGTNLAVGTTASYLWDISSDENGLIFAGVLNSTVKGRGMLFSSANNVFGGYSLSNKDASGYQRVAVLPIAAAATTYYHSSPSEIPTAINNVETSAKAVKVLKNGLLLIEKNGKTYNAQGQVVK